MARRPPKPVRRADRAQVIVDWARQTFVRELGALGPQLGHLRLDALAPYGLDAGLGQDALVQAAAIFYRTLDVDEALGLLVPIQIIGDDRVPGPCAAIFVRGLDGFLAARVFTTRSHGRRVDVEDRVAPDDLVAQLTFDEHTDVDPELDHQAALIGFPGARRRVPTVMDLVGAASAPSPVGSRIASRAVAERIVRAPPSPAVSDGPSLRWEAVRIDGAVHDFSTHLVGLAAYMHVHASAPIGFATRALQDLLDQGWRSEAQALLLVDRLPNADDFVRALDQFLASGVSGRVKRAACARTAMLGLATDDAHAVVRATSELAARTADATRGAERAFIDRVWPAKPGPGDLLACADIACLAVAAAWEAKLAMGIDGMVGLEATPAWEDRARTALGRVEALRDHLLDRCGVAPGAPAERVLAGGARLLRRTSTREIEARDDRWRDTLLAHDRVGQRPAAVLQDYATFHAAALHGVAVVVGLALRRSDALASGDRRRYRAGAESERALFAGARATLASHLVHEASWAWSDDAIPDALALLRRARSAAPDLASVRAAYNQARFESGTWDAELVTDLIRELGASDSAAPAAELVHVAGALGRRRAVRFGLRALQERTAGGRHHWMARVLALFRAPSTRADRAALADLAGTPPSFDEGASASRLEHALYGPDRRHAVADTVRALVAQKEAIEWDMLVAEVGLEPEQPAETAADAPDPSAAFMSNLQALWPLAASSPRGDALRRRAHELLRRIGDQGADLSELELELTALLAEASQADASLRVATTLAEDDVPEDDDTSPGAEPDDFLAMTLDAHAIQRSRDDLATPEWAVHVGLRQIAFYNLARGARDAKMLRGTRDARGALWELRHRDARHPVRVFYRLTEHGPSACAILAKQDDAHQRRAIERVLGWGS